MDKMFYSLLDQEPLSGFGALYQGAMVTEEIWSLPGPLFIVTMNKESADIVWVKRQISKEEGRDCSKIQGVLHVGIADMENAVLPDEVFLALIEAGYAMLSRGINLYVHCQQGISRSSYYTVGLYMRMGMSFQEAIRHVASRRKGAFPNWGFYDHLARLYKEGRFQCSTHSDEKAVGILSP